MDLDAFVTEHGAEWNRLDRLAATRRRRLTAAEVDEMVMLYRRATTHLSVVRSRAGDPALTAWLSRLVLQARAAVAPPAGSSYAAAVRFMTVSFPLAIYQSARWWGGVAAAFVGLSAIIISLVASDESIALAFMDPQEIDDLVNRDFAAYYSTYPPQNFAALVWTHNALISAIALAAGVLIVPVLYVLWQNMLNVGVVGGLMVGNDQADTFFGLILVHGMLELTCVFIAAGAGLRIGWAWIAPGRSRTRPQAIAEAGRSGMVVALGLVAPLFVSGLIEAFVTPSPLPSAIKLAIGSVALLAFLAWTFVVGARAAHAGLSADVDQANRPALAPTT